MWIGAVDIPDDLIRAHTDGNLVVFVGAGASMGSPSDLPSFLRLTELIAAEAGVALGEADRTRPDAFLGRIDDGDFDVHQRVATLLSPPASQPADLHRAIVDLAAASGLRIVTTNYDRHLSAVLAQRTINAVEYRAPALPVGDDFDGIVYLHGTLGQEPRRLVVTDRDFGHAYLTDAWASRSSSGCSTRTRRCSLATATPMLSCATSPAVSVSALKGLLVPRAMERRSGERFGITPVWYVNGDGAHAELMVTAQGVGRPREPEFVGASPALRSWIRRQPR